MSQRTQGAYNEWAANYDTDPNPHLTLEHEDVLALVAAHPGESILDAACGTGRYVADLVQAGARVRGIDFSEPMLAKARHKYPQVEFRKSDLRDSLPFSDGEFDCVLCAQALKHLPNLVPVISEFFRVLRFGGRLVFSVTHPDMNWEGYDMREHPSFVLTEHSDIFHHRFSDYFAAFDAAGFQLERIKQLTVSEKIRHLLTAESFELVKGRYQIVVFRLGKK